MSGTKLNIAITATDRASAIINKVKGALVSTNVPTIDLGRNFGSLSSSLQGLGRSAAGFGSALSSVGPQMQLLTGVATLAGVARLADAWGKMSVSVGATALRTGSGVAAISALRGAARLAGVSADGLTGSFQGFQEALTNIAGSRDPAGLSYIGQLGFQLRGANGEINKSQEGFYQMVDAIKKVADPVLRLRLMRVFGISDEMLPVINRGSAALRAQVAEAARLGAISDEAAKAGQAFAQSQERLGQALEGVGNAFAHRYAPPLTSALDYTADFIGKNHALVEVGGVLGGLLAGRMAYGALQFAAGLRAVAAAGLAASAATGGMAAAGAGGAIAGAAGSSALGLLLRRATGAAGIALYPSSTQSDDRSKLSGLGLLVGQNGRIEDTAIPDGVGRQILSSIDFFRGRGWTSEQAAGIVANLHHESGMRPDAVGDGGRSFGMAQWNGGRLRALGDFIGRDARTATSTEQHEFVNHELTRGGERAAGDRLRQARTAGEAGGIVSRFYERPAATESEAASRSETAGYLSRLEGQRGRGNPAGGTPGGAGGETTVRLVLEDRTAGGTRVTAAPAGRQDGARVATSGMGSAP